MSLASQMQSYRLTTAEILYHLPDHPGLLQSYVWQDLDLAPFVGPACATTAPGKPSTGHPAGGTSAGNLLSAGTHTGTVALLDRGRLHNHPARTNCRDPR